MATNTVLPVRAGSCLNLTRARQDNTLGAIRHSAATLCSRCQTPTYADAKWNADRGEPMCSNCSNVLAAIKMVREPGEYPYHLHLPWPPIIVPWKPDEEEYGDRRLPKFRTVSSPAVSLCKTPEQWAAYGPDPAIFTPTPRPVIGLPSGLAFPAPIPREGSLHVRCRMPGCTFEYVSNETASKKVRYVCPKHTHAQLQRARILKTEGTDRNVHFDEPEYFFNHTTPQSSPELERSSWAFKDFRGRQANAQYASDSNGRNDSDRGHAPTCGVHRPNKSAPFKPAYKPIDPVEALELSRSAWEKNVQLIGYPCQTRLAGIQLVPPFAISFPAGYVVRGQHLPFQAGKVWIKCACGRIAQCFSANEPHIIPPSPPRCPHGFMIFGEECETGLSLKCTMCAVSQDLRRPVQILPDPVYRRELNRPFMCPDCDPTVTKASDIYIYHRKDDVEQRKSPLFSARRADTGEGIEDAILTDTLTQERRLKEIVSRLKNKIEFAKKQGVLDEDAPRKIVVEFLKTDQSFQRDVADYEHIDVGEPLESRMATKRRRDSMNDRILRSSEFDFVHPDLDWAKLFKQEGDKTRQGGTFLLVKRDRYRLYRLGDFDMPGNGLDGRLSCLVLNGTITERLNDSVQSARKAARRRRQDENVAAALVLQDFLASDVIWIQRVRKQKDSKNSGKL